MLTVGVLALQGAVQEHLEQLERLPQVKGRRVTKACDLDQIDGLILPGGESTAIGKLLRDFLLVKPMQEKISAGLPVWGTCAGMILLAKTIIGEAESHLGVIDISVRRNAYGSQLDSFVTDQVLPALSDTPVPLVFIRAPRIEYAAPHVNVIATVAGHIVAAEQDNMLATSFHPELTTDVSFYRYFLNKINFASA